MICLVPGLVPLGSCKVLSSKMTTSLTFCLVPGLVPLGPASATAVKMYQILQEYQGFGLVPGLVPLGSCKRHCFLSWPCATRACGKRQ